MEVLFYEFLRKWISRSHQVLSIILVQNKEGSTIQLEGITINMLLIIEIIDEKSKLEPLLPNLKMMVDDNGLVTIPEVDII